MAILIGTSGYSYPDWRGTVYPTGTMQKDFLRCYAREFSFVELNFSYYKQPDAGILNKMVDQVPVGFHFAIKGYRYLTHDRGDAFHSESQKFREGIYPLVESSRLSAIVMQFPFSFHYDVKNRTYLDRLCGEFDSLPLAIEFRNSQWQRDSVYEGLRKRGAALVNVDEPRLPGLLLPGSLITAPYAYVRFHGRNAANWWEGDNATRYEYNYSDNELAEWIPLITSMASRAALVMVLFNNHFRGMAVENARRLRAMLL